MTFRGGTYNESRKFLEAFPGVKVDQEIQVGPPAFPATGSILVKTRTPSTILQKEAQ